MICAINPEQVNEDALLIQYGLDSVRSLDLIVALEEQFNIEISDGELSQIRTVRDVMNLVEQKLTRN
jgi:acyl carrier protein